jgi:hypothetical protein
LHKGTVLKEMWLEWLYWFVFPPPPKKKIDSRNIMKLPHSYMQRE